MRLNSISVRNVPPVRLFAAGELADVVVIAGPNGVGKTRLLQQLVKRLRSGGIDGDFQAIIQATCEEERSSWGGKESLDLSSTEDMPAFMQTLQAVRMRSKWRSSLVNIESDRTITQLRPLAPSWEYVDPTEENVPWEQTMGFMRDRYEEAVHSMFRMIQAQDHGISSRARQLRRDGHPTMNLDFEDPMEPFKTIFSLLLAPKELADPVPSRGHLEYVAEGDARDLSTLSSGEKEVVNIAFDFLLRNPQDCIVFFDEPELHLHPELSYRLIQTLRSIGQRNQFVLSTHSPDVITASLDHSVIFLSPPSNDEEEPSNQAIPVAEDDETHQALRLLGQSIGIVALGRRIVLIEGNNSSLDKQTYGAIVRKRWPGLVLVPSGGKHVAQSFETIYRSVLSRSIWGVEFFMLCDGDTSPASSPAQTTAAEEGRLKVLPRYHLENYFLDEYVWSEAFRQVQPDNSPLRNPEYVRERLRDHARLQVSHATALLVASRLRAEAGNVDAMPSGCHDKSLDELQGLIQAQVTNELTRIQGQLDSSAVRQLTSDYHDRLLQSLKNDTDEWKSLIPGKPLLASFFPTTGLRPPQAKALYLNVGLASDRAPFADVIQIFQSIAEAP